MNRKKQSLLKILLLIAVLLMYIIGYLIACKYYIISNFYINFTLVLSLIITLVTISLMIFILKKFNRMWVLFIIGVCISSVLLFIFEKDIVKKSQKVEFKKEIYYLENRDFLQNEIVVKRKSCMFFSENIGKIIIPQNCEYNISNTSNMLKINVTYDEKTISYVIDYLNNSIIEEYK